MLYPTIHNPQKSCRQTNLLVEEVDDLIQLSLCSQRQEEQSGYSPPTFE
jgi:hypothetical protein